MGFRAWLGRQRERKLDRLVASVDQHVPLNAGLRIGDAASLKCQKCKHVFDGSEEDLRRHHLEVAYRLGESGSGFVG